MTKTSPWLLLLAVYMGWSYYTGAGALSPRPWYESVAFPAYVVILVVLDHLVFPRVRWPHRKTASVKAVISLVLTVLLVWAVRPSPTVTGIVIFVALRSAWSALATAKSGSEQAKH